MRAAAIGHDDEQRLVRAFFRNATTGFFVEVGANDPYERSQTWHLEKIGWTGVLVEPQPDLAAKLVGGRTAMVFAVACSSPDNAGRIMPLYVAGPMSSLNRDRMSPGAEPELIIDVPVRCSMTFLRKQARRHRLIYCRSMSRATNWKFCMDLISRAGAAIDHCLEDHVGDLEKHRFLLGSGYRLIRRAGNNGWYVPASEPFKVNWADRWEIWRKYYLGLPFRKARNALRRIRRKIKKS